MQRDDGVHDAERILPELLTLTLEVIEDSLLQSLTLYCYDPELVTHTLVDLLYLTRELEVLAVAVDEVAEADAWVYVAYVDGSCLLAVELQGGCHVTLEVLLLKVLGGGLDDVWVQVNELDALGRMHGGTGEAALAAFAREQLRVGQWVLHADEVVRQVGSPADGAHELLQTHQINDCFVILAGNAFDTELDAHLDQHPVLEVFVDHGLVEALLLDGGVQVDGVELRLPQVRPIQSEVKVLFCLLILSKILVFERVRLHLKFVEYGVIGFERRLPQDLAVHQFLVLVRAQSLFEHVLCDDLAISEGAQFEVAQEISRQAGVEIVSLMQGLHDLVEVADTVPLSRQLTVHL